MSDYFQYFLAVFITVKASCLSQVLEIPPPRTEFMKLDFPAIEPRVKAYIHHEFFPSPR